MIGGLGVSLAFWSSSLFFGCVFGSSGFAIVTPWPGRQRRNSRNRGSAQGHLRTRDLTLPKPACLPSVATGVPADPARRRLLGGKPRDSSRSPRRAKSEGRTPVHRRYRPDSEQIPSSRCCAESWRAFGVKKAVLEGYASFEGISDQIHVAIEVGIDNVRACESEMEAGGNC